jgi:hypothetical protein
VNGNVTPDYTQLTLDELLQAAHDKEQLTDEARHALDSELSRREITISDIAANEADTAAAESAESREVREVAFSPGGIARKLLGKSNYACDERHRVEEFDRTLWFVLFFIPLFPIASYRIRRRFRHWWQFWTPDVYHVLDKLPRDWEQILVTWIKTVVILLVLRFAVPWFMRAVVNR